MWTLHQPMRTQAGYRDACSSQSIAPTSPHRNFLTRTTRYSLRFVKAKARCWPRLVLIRLTLCLQCLMTLQVTWQQLRPTYSGQMCLFLYASSFTHSTFFKWWEICKIQSTWLCSGSAGVFLCDEREPGAGHCDHLSRTLAHNKMRML